MRIGHHRTAFHLVAWALPLLPVGLLVPGTSFAQSLSLEGGCGDGPTTIRVTDITPGGSYAIITANGTGSTSVPGGPCEGTRTGLSASGLALRATLVADGRGDGEISPTIPGGLCDSAYIEVLDLETCRTTETLLLASGPEAVDATNYRDLCSGGDRDIFDVDPVDLDDVGYDPRVTAVFRKCDGSAMSADKECHVRVGSYWGSYDADLVRVDFTWRAGTYEYEASWDAWISPADFVSGLPEKEFYLCCAEPAGEWCHWRTEAPILIERS